MSTHSWLPPIVAVLLAASLCGFGCARMSTPARVEHGSADADPRKLAEAESAAEAEAEDITRAQAHGCAERASTRPFPQFISPSGSQEFRRRVATRLADLNCCASELRTRQAAGTRVRINLVPTSRDPTDGAFAELDEPIADAGPNESACVDAVLKTWHMNHAAVSDLIQPDAQGNYRARAGSISLIWAR